MKYCPNCGSQVDDQIKFCTNCGAPLQENNQPTFQQQTEPVVERIVYQQVPVQQNQPKRVSPLGIVAFVLSLTFIGAPIAVVLAILDLVLNKDRKHGLTIAGLAIGAVFSLLLASILFDSSKKEAQKAPTTSTAQVERSVPETKPDSESSREVILETESPTKAPTEKPTSKPNAISENTIRPEIKEAIDSYEEFYDQYVEFMKKLDMSDASMLMESVKMMEKLAEMEKKWDEINEMELTTAETKYLLDASIRIEKKSLELIDS